MTKGESFVQAIQLLQDYSKKGVLISPSDGNYQDKILLMPPVANAAQMEIAQYVKIPAVMSVTQNPIKNLLGMHTGFDLEMHLDEDKVYSAVGANSYSFEVDRPCTVYIKRDGQIFKTVEVTNINQFTNFKGNITPVNKTSLTQLVFSGPYPYSIRHRALYPYPFPTDADVPVYGSHVSYDMPDDYMEFDKILRWYDQRQLQETSDYKKTENKKILINWFLTGQFDIHYFKRPQIITAATPDSYEYEIDPKAHHLIPYYIAAYVCDEAKSNVKSMLLGEYRTKLQNISAQLATPVAQQIQSIY